MASKTLHAILTHWKTEIHPGEEVDYIELPFNIENFCRENDQALREAEARGMERAARIVEGWPHDYRSKDGLMVLSSRFDIARALRGNDDRAETAKESPHG